MPSPIDTIPQVTKDFDLYKELLYGLVVVNKYTKVLETGTDVGDSARIFSTALQATGGKLMTIDIKPPVNNWLEGWPIKNISYFQQDSKLVRINEEIDLLFLDAHNPEMDVANHVASELQLFGGWVRVGGKIVVDDVWHDVFGPPIRKAVEGFCRQHLLTWTYYPHDHGLCIIEMTHPVQRPSAPMPPSMTPQLPA